jgi:hypothetical protein
LKIEILQGLKVIIFFKDDPLSVISLARGGKNKTFADFLKYDKVMLVALG